MTHVAPPDGPPEGRRATALRAHVDLVETALVRGGEQLPQDATAEARRALDVVQERLEIGVDHTVVALLGGTGSGKSSLFNALSGLRLADVGARRPTTSRATACAWSHGMSSPGPLLDWLGVERDRRMERESELDGESQADLRGLVLLDLPDHDSVAPEHRDVVDRLLPMADLLVWVVDPQKYADDALHTGYLRHLVGHEQAMVVVLNQIDTVPPGSRAALLADVARLLREDGLVDVPVHGVSALEGDGLGDVRALLAATVAGRGATATRARAELDTAVRGLTPHVGAAEPELEPLTSRALAGLADAVGLPAAVDLLRAGGAARPLEAPDPERVAQVRAEWVTGASAGLPSAWTEAVERAAGPVGALTAAVTTAVAAVPLPAPDARPAVLARVTDALRPASARTRRAAVAETYDAGVRAAVAGVLAEHLVAPTRAVLDDHRAVRTTVEAAAVLVASTDPAVDGSSTAGRDPAAP